MSKKVVAFGLMGFFIASMGLLLFFPLHFSSIDYKAFHFSWVQSFRQQHKPQSTFPLSEIIRDRASAELNQSDLFLPHYNKYNEDEIFLLQKYSLSCDENTFLKKPKKSSLEKTWRWQESRCNNSNLSSTFFQKGPFIHPSGQSFTKLALQEGIIQLQGLESTLSFEEYLKIILRFKSLSPLAISLLKDHANFVIGDDYVFLLKENEHSSVSYEAFTAQDWKSFLNSTPFLFEPAPNSDTKCFDRTEQGCWVERTNHSAVIIRILSALAGLLLILIVGISIYYRQKSRRLKKLEDEKRKFALQMLTHELRTPATSLSLLVENMRQNFDAIGDINKENFLKLCDEVFRLQSMTKTSYQYLQTDSLREDFKINLSRQDFKAYFENLAEKYSQKIELKMNCRNLHLYFDWFWLDLCLQNLLRNAFEHGKGKVTLQVEAFENHLDLSVLDDGKLEISERELFQAFKKNPKSRGLGLGLSIVSKILNTLHVEFKYVGEPRTEFKITIPRERYDYTFN